MSKLKIKSDDYINQLRFHDGTWYMLGMENLGGVVVPFYEHQFDNYIRYITSLFHFGSSILGSIFKKRYPTTER